MKLALFYLIATACFCYLDAQSQMPLDGSHAILHVGYCFGWGGGEKGGPAMTQVATRHDGHQFHEYPDFIESPNLI